MLFSYSLLTVPSEGPKGISFDEVNQTTYKIFWSPLAREKRNGVIIGHEIKREKASTEARSKPSIEDITYSNSANSFALVTGFQPACNYSISVRAFTLVGRGPYGEKETLKISSRSLSSMIKDKEKLIFMLLIFNENELKNSITVFTTLPPVL